MRNGWTSATTAAAVVLASSLFAVALNGQQGSPNAKAPTASSQPFDPHDLSGFWDITTIGRPAGALNAIEQQPASHDAVGLGKISKDKDGIR